MDEDEKPLPHEDDIELKSYQDDLDADETHIDEVTHEATDDPVATFGVPEDEYGQELDRLAVDENEDDDQRETVEDMDEGDVPRT